MKSYELGQVRIGSNIAQNHSPTSKEVMSDHYLPPTHSERLTESKNNLTPWMINAVRLIISYTQIHTTVLFFSS